jgi:hypothetical protein
MAIRRKRGTDANVIIIDKKRRTSMSKNNTRKGSKKVPTSRLPKVAQHADFLSLLKRAKTKEQRNKLFEMANKQQIDSISEIILNILHGTIVLTKLQQSRLFRYKNCLRLIARKQTPLPIKKSQLKTYRGGFLPALIGLAAPVISSLISGLIHRK